MPIVRIDNWEFPEVNGEAGALRGLLVCVIGSGAAGAPLLPERVAAIFSRPQSQLCCEDCHSSLLPIYLNYTPLSLDRKVLHFINLPNDACSHPILVHRLLLRSPSRSRYSSLTTVAAPFRSAGNARWLAIRQPTSHHNPPPLPHTSSKFAIQSC